MSSQQDPTPIFFAFPDGVLDYVCPECTALCCRGQGFAGSIKREMNFLFRKYPPLAGMVTAKESSIVTCSTPAGRCYFLRADNLCQIEVENGQRYKPGVCLLFPFNDLHRIGKTVVVAPHFMCPLRLRLPADPDRVQGSHAKIEATVRETGLLEPEFLKRFVTVVTLPEGVGERTALRLETEFRDRCAQALGHGTFRKLLEESSADVSDLRSFRKRVTEVMRWTTPRQAAVRDGIDDLLLALAPTMRLEVLHHSSEGLLRFLTVAEILARRAFTMSVSLPTPQGVYSVLEDMRPMLQLLAWSDDAPDLKKVTLKSPTFGDPNLVYAADMFLHKLPTRGVLRALEAAVKPLPSPADRTALVQQVAATVSNASRRRPV
jgi:hypothetical protein